MIIDNMSSDNFVVSNSCSTCGERFKETDHVIVWKDSSLHVACVIQILDNMDTDFSYIVNEIIDTKLLERIFDGGIKIPDDIRKLNNDDCKALFVMLRKFYDFFDMAKPIDEN